MQAQPDLAQPAWRHAWATVHEVLERDFPGQSIVGWYHSHPGFGISLSTQDVFIHQNFFSSPGQTAYVIDPHWGSEGIFAWHGQELLEVEHRRTSRPPSRTRPLRRDTEPEPGPSEGRRYPLIG